MQFLLTHYLLQLSFQRKSDEEEGHKRWMVTSRSFDNLKEMNKEEEVDEKRKSKGNIISRFFKARTLQIPSKKKTKQKSNKGLLNRDSIASETSCQGDQSSLASSLSMPEIACKCSAETKCFVICCVVSLCWKFFSFF